MNIVFVNPEFSLAFGSRSGRNSHLYYSMAKRMLEKRHRVHIWSTGHHSKTINPECHEAFDHIPLPESADGSAVF